MKLYLLTNPRIKVNVDDIILTMTTVIDRPVRLSERAPHIDKPATDDIKNLLLFPNWVLDTKTDWLTDRRS
jgi:hypothetical protein